MKEQSVGGERSIRANVALESAGAVVSRYGLVVILLLIGILKFTPAEADGIQPLVAHSPFMSWMYLVVSKQGVSNFIGVVELLIALLLALFSTPGAIQLGHGVEILGGTGQFLIKDLVLLGASFWTAAEALRAANGRNVPRAV